MIIGVFEMYALDLRRIRGVLARLVLLPLAVEWFIFIMVCKYYADEIHNSYLDSVIYGGYVIVMFVILSNFE